MLMVAPMRESLSMTIGMARGYTLMNRGTPTRETLKMMRWMERSLLHMLMESRRNVSMLKEKSRGKKEIKRIRLNKMNKREISDKNVPQTSSFQEEK